MYNIKLLFSYLFLNIKKLTEYKLDFIFNLLSVFIWIGAGLVNILILFTNIKTFDGWNLAEVGLLYGMWSLTFAIYNVFGSGILDIENNIISGSMDIMLIKPIGPLFQIIVSKINTMGLGFLSFGIIMIIVSSMKINIEWNIFKICYLIFMILAGGGLIFATYLILASLSFWFIKSSSAIKIGYDIHKFSQYPLSIYGNGIKVILSFILPYAFTNYYPIAFLLGKVNVIYGIISPLVCILFVIISICIWKLGLKKYEGCGS